MPSSLTALENISPDLIDRNPDNPRLVFREDELNHLLTSIQQAGIEVPLTVYRTGSRYTLIDGERRWRCAKKLNLSAVPVLVQPTPSRLGNILMMFNIHSVRVDWDPLPTAIKLKQIQILLREQNRPHELRDLSALTGLSVTRLRRLFDLLALPAKYRSLILGELEKPRDERRYTEDLFLEIYKALHAIERFAPAVFESVSQERFVDSMVRKYESGAAGSVVSYRAISKMARGIVAGVGSEQTLPVLIRLVEEPSYSIARAFEDSVSSAYDRRDLASRIRTVSERLSKLRGGKRLDPELRVMLRELQQQVNRLIGPET
ncbi:MAG: ParB/RepB/Spo0J family partition protein [Thermoplasmata archaeon]